MAEETNQELEFLRISSLFHDEMAATNAMYLAYPDGYDQRVADTNNRMYHDYVRATFKGQRMDPVVRVLLRSGLALTMSRAYYCARAEVARSPGSPVEIFDPERPTGPPVDVKDAYVSLRSLMGTGKLRQRLQTWNLAIDGNEDLVEIVQNIQRDGNEASDLRRWE